jgi:hypothetical protein
MKTTYTVKLQIAKDKETFLKEDRAHKPTHPHTPKGNGTLIESTRKWIFKMLRGNNSYPIIVQAVKHFPV